MITFSTLIVFQAMNAVVKFGWPTMKVSPLDNSQKMEIITGYLEGIYGKTLSQEQKEMIVEAKQTDNPLYLRSLLDEVSRNYIVSSVSLSDQLLFHLLVKQKKIQNFLHLILKFGVKNVY